MGSICSAVFMLLAFAIRPRRDEPTADLQPQVSLDPVMAERDPRLQS
jgi:hypothetical protein